MYDIFIEFEPFCNVFMSEYVNDLFVFLTLFFGLRHIFWFGTSGRTDTVCQGCVPTRAAHKPAAGSANRVLGSARLGKKKAACSALLEARFRL